MLNKRQDFGACIVGNFIYVCGGSTSDCEEDALNNLERMDTHTGRWIPLSPAKKKCIGCSLSGFEN